MALWKKILISIIAIFAFIGIIGFFILPAVIKPIAVEKLAALLHRQVTIEKISINPYALSVIIRGFKISNPAPSTSPFVAFDELYLNLHGAFSLFQRKLIMEEIKLTKPYIGVVRADDGTYNFADLLPKEEKKPADSEQPFYFSLNNIQIAGGSIDFRDNANKTNHTVRDMNLAVPVISNIEHYIKNYVEPRFSANINGHSFELTGKTKPLHDSRETVFDVAISDLDIPFYWKYVPVKMNFKLKSARLDTKLKINFIMSKDKQPVINISGDVALRKIVLDDLKNNKILRLPELNCAIASAEPLNSDIHLARLSFRDIELAVKRNKDGQLNLLNLVAEQTKEKKKQNQAADKRADPQKKPLKIVIDELELTASNLTFTDDTPAKKAFIRIAPLRLKAKNLSTVKAAKGDLDLSLIVDKKGEVAVKGQFGLEPLVGDLNVDVKNIAIRTFQSYYTDLVKVNVQQGTVSTAGRFSLSGDEKGAPRIKYAGKLYISNLAVADESHANDFLSWKQLYFAGVEVGHNPFFINIKGISLADFYVRIIVNADSTLNLQNIFSGGEKKEAGGEITAQSAGKKEEEEKQKVKHDDKTDNIKIGTVTFQGGTIDFTDRLIKPNYSVRMLNMAGFVKGLSTTEISRADVNLKGNLGYGSPVEITGKINPLIKDLFADVKFEFRDIELSPVTPYSSKYLGHPITKGKLTFTVEYLVDKRKLDAKNKILIDQLTLGDKVASPDAIKAPVGLAVSLLTDRNGQINLDIPVSGSLDDPKFSVWPIVWQVIVNLITKALTSPFALLTALTGGGEELSFIEFDYGSPEISAANLQKISALTKALQQRPQLKIDISGYVDPENDREGLKKAEFDRKLKAQKIKEAAAKGEEAMPIGQISIKPEEYEKYLTLAYNAEKFAKPQTAVGLPKKLPKEEMEKLMMTNMNVTDSDLRQLAARRAENIKELLLQSGEAKSAQIFIVEPKTLAAEKKEKVKLSRVDFKLK
ncbi:MAG: hypothetical protein CVU54_08400 [Deltaproteobacteria bacterium HGW-Deltaproteobacteria-12]|jgi:uncharacterized protein involved in outer membrane biogenesis|nr:MAG: hypothetical protein CVU54_08400 [Deltaproteobacteria bacterium HGW-Deltaproteobacteria-12]